MRTTTATAAPISRDTTGALAGTAAMALVGSSAAVLAVLDTYPTFGGQAIRYAGATALLASAARLRSVPAVRPGPGEIGRLVVLAALGLAGFNVFFVQAVRHADPSTVGAVIGGLPIILAVSGAIAERRRPAPGVVLAATTITAGVGLTQGFGGGSPTGLMWAAGALAAEAAFSILAVPLLPRLGPLGVSKWASAIAVPVLLLCGAAADGTALLRLPTGSEAAALVYLAAIVTAAAFLLWYTAVDLLGADRAGLHAGLVPVSAVAATAVIGSGSPGAVDLVGCVLVAAGVFHGVRRQAPEASRRDRVPFPAEGSLLPRLETCGGLPVRPRPASLRQMR